MSNVILRADLSTFIAGHADVQRHMDVVALRKGAKAEALMADHYNEGDAFITVEDEGNDRLVVLNDTKGQLHAMSIEYGRDAGNAPRWAPWFGRGTKATSILHKTFLGKTAKAGRKWGK